MLPTSQKGDVAAPFFLPLGLAGALLPPPEVGCKLPQDGDPLKDAHREKMAQFGDIFEGFGEIDLANTCKTFNLITQEIETRTVRNPLQVQYFGAAPFGFGPDQAMKFSAAPCEKREQAVFENVVAGDPSPDYLREALTETMKGDDDVCFDFMIQVRGADELEEQHVENATTIWPDELTSYERVARTPSLRRRTQKVRTS